MSEVLIRRADKADLAAIVAMLADDALGRARENASVPLAQAYQDAFATIDGNPNHFLAVMTDGAEVIGTLQISFIPRPVVAGRLARPDRGGARRGEPARRGARA